MPVPTSQQPATEDGCRERALSNKDNQHAILAWTIYLLKSQRELSDGDVVMLQQTATQQEYFIKVLYHQVVLFWCHHSPKVLTSRKIDVL
jgi:adenine-specific DNA methylase